jgi:hypothetical protein
VSADGTTAANLGNGGVGTSLVSGQFWGKSMLACLCSVQRLRTKHQPTEREGKHGGDVSS